MRRKRLQETGVSHPSQRCVKLTLEQQVIRNCALRRSEKNYINTLKNSIFGPVETVRRKDLKLHTDALTGVIFVFAINFHFAIEVAMLFVESDVGKHFKTDSAQHSSNKCKN